MKMKTDIVRQLCTRGTFVMLQRNNKLGVVRRFDRRTNMALVQWSATGLVDSMVSGGLDEDWLRDQGMATDHHFADLRLASTAEIDGRA